MYKYYFAHTEISISAKILFITSILMLVIIFIFVSPNEVFSQNKNSENDASKVCALGSPKNEKWAKLNEYDLYFESAGKEFGIDPNILKGMSMIESGGVGQYDVNGNVIEGPDNFGDCAAVGVMQVKPCNWKGVADQIGANLYEPEGNIRTAAKLMSDWTKETGSWENAITQKYHPGTGQHGLTQDGYIENMYAYLEELGAAECSGSTISPSKTPTNPNKDQSPCVITKVGNPLVSPVIPAECNTASEGDLAGILPWADKITSVLEPALWTYLNNQEEDICNEAGYCANKRSGVSTEDLYWCTFLVIDAYNLSGYSGLTPDKHLGVIYMVPFFQDTEGYIFLPYNPEDTSDAINQRTLQQVKPGMAFFMAQDLTVTQSMEHTGLVKSISIDSHGNGSIETYESNSDTISHTFTISDWTVMNMFYPLRGFGGV